MLAMDGVNAKMHKKGDVIVPSSAFHARICDHLVQKGEAEPVSGESDVKTVPPKETKAPGKKGRKKKGE